MTSRDAAIALAMQKVVDLSSLTNFPHCIEAKFLFVSSLMTASRCNEEECHGEPGTMS